MLTIRKGLTIVVAAGAVELITLEVTLEALAAGVAARVAAEASGAATLKATSAHLGSAAGTAEGTTNRAWLTLEAVVALLTAGQDTTLLLKVGHADSWEGRGGVVLSSVVVNLVDGHGGVDDVGLDGLLLDNGLDSLVDVVVNVLAGDDGGDGAGVLALDTDLLVTELLLLGRKTGLDLLGIVVLELAVLDRDDVVVVLLGENLTVGHRLDRGVVVVLVDLFVDGGHDLLVLLAGDGLVDNGRGDLLVDSGVMVTRLGPARKESQRWVG